MAQKAQHAILRFAKHKAGPAGALEAHHERTKEQYASNPDIDTSRSKDNFHIIQPAGKYRREIDSRIRAAGCRTRKDSTMFVDTLITASPEFFTGRSKKEVQAYFTEAAAFMEKKVARCILPDILAFYESEEGQREFSEWKKQREIEKQEAKTE